MVSPAPAAPSARFPRSAALLLTLVATLAPALQAQGQTTRVVGPVTFEEKDWLGLAVADLVLDRFDGVEIPRVSFGFLSADDGTAVVRVGPEDAAYVRGQGLEGPTDSVLTLEFAEPIVGLQAGMAFLADREEAVAVRVEASNEAGERVYAHDFPSSIGSATLFPGTLVRADFNGQVSRVDLMVTSKARRFFLDNLVITFDGGGLPTAQPPDANAFAGRAPKAVMAGLSDSRAVAAWPEEGVVRFQTISADGEPDSPIRVATASGGSGWAPTVTAHDGGFALLWYGRDNTANAQTEGVYLQFHTAQGVPISAQVQVFSPQTRRATRISLDAVSLGEELIVTWNDGEKLGAVRYSPGEDSLIPIPLTGQTSSCGLRALAVGQRTAVFWCAIELWMQLYDESGSPLGPPVSVSEGLAGSPTTLRVAKVPRGTGPSRAIVWTQAPGAGGPAAYVRTFTENGLLSPAVQISPGLAKNTLPAIAGHSNGSFLVTWLEPNRPGQAELPRRLWAQVFYASGVAATEPLQPLSELNADPESVVLVWNGRLATMLWQNSVSSSTLPGGYISTFEAEADRTPCRASATSLCLQGSRFRVSAQYRDFQGAVGVGRPVGLTGDTGYFWFFDQGAADLVVKVLDGRSTNGHHWVYFGSLTNVAFDLMIEDRLTGQSTTYSNQLGSFASAGDTRAFESLDDQLVLGVEPAPAETAWTSPGWSDAVALSSASESQPLQNEDLRVGAGAEAGVCSEALEAHPLGACLSERFLVEVEWQGFDGTVGDGHGQTISEDTASFWFFGASNLELVIKVLDGSDINGHFWVFFGSLTNVAFDLTVTDLVTGASRTWSNPGGVFASRGDTTALPAD